jgi:hypothetical protein
MTKRKKVMKPNPPPRRKIKRRKNVCLIYSLSIKTFVYSSAAAVATDETNGTHISSLQQTNPPSIPISDLYPDGNYPEGQTLEHPTPKHPSADG